MKLDDIIFGRRVRQNHALEHATFTIMAQMEPTFTGSARSSADGFLIFNDVDLGLLRRALDEALRRLQAGEAELAIHPNCGTNLAVGISVAGWAAARPLGEYMQKHFTTLPDLKGVRVTEIARRKFLGYTYVEVRTVQE